MVKCDCKDFRFNESVSFKCEEEFFHIRVMKFDEGCQEYKAETYRLSLACVPIYIVSI